MSVVEDRRTIVLDQAPPLARSYAAAARKAAASAVPGLGRSARGAGGQELPPVAHRVGGVRAERSRLARYQRLMGDTLRDSLPSVFVHGLAFPIAMGVLVADDFPLPLLGMVHLANRVEHRRTIGADEALTVTAWAENLRPHFAGTQVDVVAEVSAPGGADGDASAAGAGSDVVWRGVSTYLARGVDAPGAVRPQRPSRPDFDAPMRTGQWRLPADTGREYASILGDWNPIHLSSLSARALGMKRHIAHGMYSAGRALASTAPVAGGYTWSIEFEAPVFLPATVQFAVADAAEAGPGALQFTGFKRGASRPYFSGTVAPR
ncbi:MaoC/PaaZ C-terminal domain-containing protein [Zhihengliuella sp.]|uniref:MaoC family dehydratase n=1 Tax=Zhihengliuella sp. TaxID=1954483 RepID=UPI0028122E1C|nr:MaoC/PaaZ C-terminal domain-containing protein [Zhihengliuella sp.]